MKEQPKLDERQIIKVLTGLLAAFLTAILSNTIVVNAFPAMMAELAGTQTDFAWVMVAPLLTTAVSTPIWGKMADIFNKKTLFQFNIVIFVAGCVMAGSSNDVVRLIAARAVQGLALGGLMALSMAILGTTISPRDRGKYSGYVGAVATVGTAGGPLLGGFIVDSVLGWRWTFFVCIPLAVVALGVIHKTLNTSSLRRSGRVDWLGAVLLTAAVSLFIVWISFAGRHKYYPWWSWQTAAMLLGTLLISALLLFIETKVEDPIIPLKIVMERTTALCILASMTFGGAMFGAASFLSQYYQVARGTTPTEAGLLTLPMVAGNLLGSVAVGQFISRYGRWKRYLVTGAIFAVAGLALCGTMGRSTELWLTGLYTAALGLGLGMLIQNLVLAVQNTVSSEHIGTASATVAFFRSVGGAVGVAFLGALLGRRVNDLATQEGAVVGEKGVTPDFTGMSAPAIDVVRGAYAEGTGYAFLIAAGIALIGLVAVICIRELPLRQTIELPDEAANSSTKSNL